jgi:HK97 family phage major capsid protein
MNGFEELEPDLNQVAEKCKNVRNREKSIERTLEEVGRDTDDAAGQIETLVAASGAPGESVVITERCAHFLGAVVVLGALYHNRLSNLSEQKRQDLLRRARGIVGDEVLKSPLTASDIPLPIEYSSEVIQLVSKYGKARQYAFPFELGKGTTKLPRLKTSPAFDFISQSASIPEKVPQTELISFTPEKVGGIVRVPSELSDDALFDLGLWVANYCARELARFEDQMVWNADGSSSPWKSFKGAGKSAFDLGRKVTLGSGLTKPSDVTLASLRSMRAQVVSAALVEAAYYFHPSMEALFVSFNDGLHDAPVYVTDGNGNATLDGFPVRYVEVLPIYETTARVSQIQGVFGEMSMMFLGHHGLVNLKVSTDVYFATDEIGIRAIERLATALMADGALSCLVLAAS